MKIFSIHLSMYLTDRQLNRDGREGGGGWFSVYHTVNLAGRNLFYIETKTFQWDEKRSSEVAMGEGGARGAAPRFSCL